MFSKESKKKFEKNKFLISKEITTTELFASREKKLFSDDYSRDAVNAFVTNTFNLDR